MYAGQRRRLLDRARRQGRLPGGQDSRRQEKDRGPAARRPLRDRGEEEEEERWTMDQASLRFPL